MSDEAKPRCQDRHPWTDMQCALPQGHDGNHDPDTSALHEVEIDRQRAVAAGEVQSMIARCKEQKMVPEILGGIMFAAYLQVMDTAGFSFGDVVRTIGTMLTMAQGELRERRQQEGTNAPGGAS